MKAREHSTFSYIAEELCIWPKEAPLESLRHTREVLLEFGEVVTGGC